jgi:hypothetical protein
MSAPEIVECTITRKTTHYGMGGVVRPELYAFAEILMVDAEGRHYCSRTWEDIPDNPFNRAHQIAQFKQRWDMNERRSD